MEEMSNSVITQKGKIIGISNIGKTHSFVIADVLLVDGLKHNLLSISQLCDKGYNVYSNQSCAL
jgi:hypothetical protein